MRRTVALAGAITCAVLAVPQAAFASHAQLIATVVINHAELPGNQVHLDPSQPIDMSLDITNSGPAPVDIGSVRLAGTAIGLTFFAYDVDVNASIPAGKEITQSFTIDDSDLAGQARGLMPITVELRDGHRHVLATSHGTADVKGSWASVWGVFGLIVFIATVLGLLLTLLALARHRLPNHRFGRALRFLMPGIGIGLTAVFSLSAFRVAAPTLSVWMPIAVGCALGGFAVGYATPTPVTDNDVDNDDDSDSDPEAVPVVAASRSHSTQTAPAAPVSHPTAVAPVSHPTKVAPASHPTEVAATTAGRETTKAPAAPPEETS